MLLKVLAGVDGYTLGVSLAGDVGHSLGVGSLAAAGGGASSTASC